MRAEREEIRQKAITEEEWASVVREDKVLTGLGS
jgi:hypothetical protein